MMETVSNSMPWIVLILGYGFLTHGIILFNDGLYWDGWLVDLWQQYKDRKSMRRFYWEVACESLLRAPDSGPTSKAPLAYRVISLARS